MNSVSTIQMIPIQVARNVKHRTWNAEESYPQRNIRNAFEKMKRVKQRVEQLNHQTSSISGTSPPDPVRSLILSWISHGGNSARTKNVPKCYAESPHDSMIMRILSPLHLLWQCLHL